MNRRKFLGIAGGTLAVGGLTYYLASDKSNFTRSATKTGQINTSLKTDEHQILYLASLAPSGHNTQPWQVKSLAPYHWIIGNDSSKWLPAVDPTQRETILSIGAFLQNLNYAANSFGYECEIKIIAKTNQDENLAEVKLLKTGRSLSYDTKKIIRRRTVRSHYLDTVLKKEDQDHLLGEEPDFLHYIPNSVKSHQWLNEQTLEANRIQTYRDAAQEELADWIRFSSIDAERHSDGLTTASMEIEGIPAWILRNFYGKKDVLKKSFREQGLDKVKEQLAHSAGWILITSRNNDTETLIETGRRMQRLFLKVRARNIALHPMTQILEEPITAAALNPAIGIKDPVQFILRCGYLKDYPDPVSLRRSVEKFFKT